MPISPIKSTEKKIVDQLMNKRGSLPDFTLKKSLTMSKFFSSYKKTDNTKVPKNKTKLSNLLTANNEKIPKRSLPAGKSDKKSSSISCSSSSIIILGSNPNIIQINNYIPDKKEIIIKSADEDSGPRNIIKSKENTMRNFIKQAKNIEKKSNENYISTNLNFLNNIVSDHRVKTSNCEPSEYLLDLKKSIENRKPQKTLSQDFCKEKKFFQYSNPKLTQSILETIKNFSSNFSTSNTNLVKVDENIPLLDEKREKKNEEKLKTNSKIDRNQILTAEREKRSDLTKKIENIFNFNQSKQTSMKIESEEKRNFIVKTARHPHIPNLNLQFLERKLSQPENREKKNEQIINFEALSNLKKIIIPQGNSAKGLGIVLNRTKGLLDQYKEREKMWKEEKKKLQQEIIALKSLISNKEE